MSSPSISDSAFTKMHYQFRKSDILLLAVNLHSQLEYWFHRQTVNWNFIFSTHWNLVEWSSNSGMSSVTGKTRIIHQFETKLRRNCQKYFADHYYVFYAQQNCLLCPRMNLFVLFVAYCPMVTWHVVSHRIYIVQFLCINLFLLQLTMGCWFKRFVLFVGYYCCIEKNNIYVLTEGTNSPIILQNHEIRTNQQIEKG